MGRCQRVCARRYFVSAICRRRPVYPRPAPKPNRCAVSSPDVRVRRSSTIAEAPIVAVISRGVSTRTLGLHVSVVLVGLVAVSKRSVHVIIAMVSLVEVDLPAPADRKVTVVIVTMPRGGRVVA